MATNTDKETMRIVLKEQDAAIVKEIMARTGISTGSDAVGVILKKCGVRFLNWWDTGCLMSDSLTPQLQPEPVVAPASSVPAVNFDEPITW